MSVKEAATINNLIFLNKLPKSLRGLVVLCMSEHILSRASADVYTYATSKTKPYKPEHKVFRLLIQGTVLFLFLISQCLWTVFPLESNFCWPQFNFLYLD